MLCKDPSEDNLHDYTGQTIQFHMNQGKVNPKIILEILRKSTLFSFLKHSGRAEEGIRSF